MVVESLVEAELQRARQARLSGNEGRARVCARRAAGLATREYLVRRGTLVHTSSAYDLLRLLAKDPYLPDAMQQTVARLTLRVGEDFKLPVDVDLISEARKLCGFLSEAP